MDSCQSWRLTLVALCCFGSIANAAMLASMPTFPAAMVNKAAAVTTAAPPSQSYYGEVDKRQLSSSYLCGVSGAEFTRYCVTRSQVCAVSVYPNGNAYAYCSNTDYGDGDQVVFTTGIASTGGNKCIAPTGCCSGESANIQTLYFTSAGYTVTNFGCETVDTTITLSPYPWLLNPSDFSVSLADATMSFSSSSSSSSPAPTPTPTDGGGDDDPSDDSDDEPNSDSSSGLSSGTKIGIGAGVGAGVGIVLISGIIFFCWRRRIKKKERNVPEVTNIGGGYDPRMSYNQYYQRPVSPQWGPQSSYSPPKVYPVGGLHHPPQELQGQAYGPNAQ